jgi:hypothetical protein
MARSVEKVAQILENQANEVLPFTGVPVCESPARTQTTRQSSRRDYNENYLDL